MLMGRIKTKLIKAKTRDFLEESGDQFSADFTENKKALAVLAYFPSKRMRNAIAGYLSRKKKAQR
jgi:small subunit ribosomal protein S17e